MRIWLIVLLVSGCVQPGDFCDLYTEVRMQPATATFITTNDRPAAEAIGTNEGVYETCK